MVENTFFSAMVYWRISVILAPLKMARLYDIYDNNNQHATVFAAPML